MSFKKYTDPRSWTRALWRVSIHSGTGALLATLGTMATEKMLPTLGVRGLDLRQSLSVFMSAAIIAALKFINEQTEDEDEPTPVTPPPTANP